MKAKKLNQRFTLNKQTVANLTAAQASAVRGGARFSNKPGCLPDPYSMWHLCYDTQYCDETAGVCFTDTCNPTGDTVVTTETTAYSQLVLCEN